MYPTLSEGIRHLLLEDGRVCLPGIGTLVVAEQAAVISLIEGRAAPPSALLNFNGNLVVDDGRLRQFVNEHGGDENKLDLLSEQLAAGKTVLLEGVGKLYRKDHNGIDFTPVADNFSKSSFGLPSVRVAPVLRKEKVSILPAAPEKTRTKYHDRSFSRPGHNRDRGKWIAVGSLVVVVLALTAYLMLRPASVNPSTASRNLPVVEASRIAPGSPPALSEVVPTGEAEPLPPADSAIIAIGLFGRQRNVEKVANRLSEAGYEPYIDRVGRNTRIGTRVAFTDTRQLDSLLADVRKNFAPEAFVMRINGDPRRPK